MPHEHPLVPQQRGFYLGLLDDTRRFKKRKAMPDTPSSKTELVFSSLSTKHATAFELRPDAPEMTRIAQELGLQGLRKVRFTGKIAPAGKADWELSAELGATIVQPCAITTDPVTTRIDTNVTRRYVANFEHPTGVETEMPEDDTAEPLPEVLNLEDVMLEALDLSLPLFPRAEGASLEQTQFTEPGVAPMTDDDAKPFASLASLRDKLAGSEE